MRLLALADERPRLDPRELVARNRPDLVVTLGDLRYEWVAGLAELDVPRLGVHGNHDPPGLLAQLGVDDLHGRRVDVGGWSFAGFEGAPGRRGLPQDEASRAARALPAADVLLCHAPPEGLDDEPDDPAHVGFRGLRDWVERHRPRAVLHGHTTPDPRTRVHRFGATRVVWVRGARILELADER